MVKRKDFLPLEEKKAADLVSNKRLVRQNQLMFQPTNQKKMKEGVEVTEAKDKKGKEVAAQKMLAIIKSNLVILYGPLHMHLVR